MLIYPVSVPGDTASTEIIEGILFFNKARNVDTIIIGRGGGSAEDLWVFNDEDLARAAAASDIPIVSAVGHETDFTILDFVSDLRAPTPSAAAELVVPSRNEINNRITNADQRMYKSLKSKLDLFEITLNTYISNLEYNSPLKRISDARIYIDTIDKDIYDIIRNFIDKKKDMLYALCSSLNELSPLSVLARGYGIVKTKDNKVLKSVRNVEKDDILNVKLSDGELTCKVEGVEMYEKV